MKRREFLTVAGALVASTRGLRAVAQDDVAAVKDTVRAYYSYYATLDKAKYRALLTDDYVLLEDGKVLDADGDIALLPAPDSGFQRTDEFDFRTVKVQSDVAYAVYVLKSEITDRQGTRRRVWLESMILRRVGNGWRVTLLHSSRITPPSGPEVAATSLCTWEP